VEQRVSKPTDPELTQLETQRSWVRDHYDEAARTQYDTLDGKLRLLQAILDAGWIEPTETLKLQSLGVTLGDALAQEMGLEWVTVEDEFGQTAALRFPGTTVLAFPRTMISKRVERGERVDVKNLFLGICDDLAGMTRTAEYQRH
jgi:hypothetical protein